MNRLFLLFISVITIGTGAHAMEHLSLIEAAAAGDLKAVQQCIDEGQNINQTDNHDCFALIYAAFIGQLPIVECLIKAEADIDQKNDNGQTALIYAVLSGRLLIVECLIKAGADIDQKDNNGQTALIYAANGSDLACCKALVRAMLQPSTEQKNRIYEFLLCMKELHGTQYSNIRNIFIPHLQALIKEENKPRAIAEIEKINNQDIKNQLLELCESQELK